MTEEQNNNAQRDAWTQNPPVQDNSGSQQWEKELITKLTMGALIEQRRTRRWGIFFKLFMVSYLLVILFLMIPKTDGGMGVGKKHTALVELSGVIAANSEASADNVVSGLRDAFENKNTAGVILRINSPGGSPVQSGYISDEIKRLRKLHPDVHLYAVVADMCASGGYYVAAAADEIYADKASMVGSIGVLMSSFGFVDTLDKLGVERRLLTAGEHKGFLDPFSPMKESDVDHVRSMLGNIHQQFIDTVKAGRGDRLKSSDDLFSGLVWTGEQSLEMGLIDGLGSASYVAREIIGEERIVDFTFQPDPFERFADRLGVVMAQTFAKIAGFKTATLH